jgi:hypothetical protein
VQINAHGLALWVTTPDVLVVARRQALVGAGPRAARDGALVALPTLFYQNTGWVQFGYRFSNDYAPLLFLLLAIVGPTLRAASCWPPRSP